MKLNISYPANGSQKTLDIDDERKLRPFMEKRMGADVCLRWTIVWDTGTDDGLDPWRLPR